MPEITRAQFALAAAVVALAAWLGSRALAPRPPLAGGAGVAAVTAAPQVAGGEPGVGKDPAGDSGAARGGGTDAGNAGPSGAAAAAERRDGAVLQRAPAEAVVVHVAGAVRRPGVYRMKSGDRLADAVARAGGRTRRADLDAINLAAPVKDGSQILVPRRASSGGPPTAAGMASSGAPAGGGGQVGAAGAGGAAPAVIDLNTATAEQLETLDGVGPATAAKILAYRTEHGPFRSVDDLEQIAGIGPKKLAAMRPRVRV